VLGPTGGNPGEERHVGGGDHDIAGVFRVPHSPQHRRRRHRRRRQGPSLHCSPSHQTYVKPTFEKLSVGFGIEPKLSSNQSERSEPKKHMYSAPGIELYS